jgi:hypothetical protein
MIISSQYDMEVFEQHVSLVWAGLIMQYAECAFRPIHHPDPACMPAAYTVQVACSSSFGVFGLCKVLLLL